MAARLRHSGRAHHPRHTLLRQGVLLLALITLIGVPVLGATALKGVHGMVGTVLLPALMLAAIVLGMFAFASDGGTSTDRRLGED